LRAVVVGGAYGSLAVLSISSMGNTLYLDKGHAIGALVWKSGEFCSMTAMDFLKWMRDVMFCCPHTREGPLVGKPSNSELRRWLRNGSILINDNNPQPGDDVTWPITQLVFFPGTDLQVTVIDNALLRF
jgi:hypothetical protein